MEPPCVVKQDAVQASDLVERQGKVEGVRSKDKQKRGIMLRKTRRRNKNMNEEEEEERRIRRQARSEGRGEDDKC